MAEAAFNCLVASAFAMAFTLPVGRLLLAAAFVLLCVSSYRRQRAPELTGVMWLSIAFFLVSVISTMQGVDPGGTWSKLRKLLWYIIGIYTYASVINSSWRLGLVLNSFSAGAGVLAVWTLITKPIAALNASREGGAFFDTLRDSASMTDAQRLVVGILVTLAAVVICRKLGRRCLVWVAVLVLQALALLITFKRGSWICLVLVIGVLLAIKANWRYLAGLAAAVLLLALLPPVRGRLADLRSEFNSDRGGRLTMWFEIAPVLSRQNPWFGVGWRAVTEEMMVAIAPHVERNRNHLHSNIAEIIVETGWIGFAVYAAWMVKALWDSASFYMGVRRKSEEEAFASLAILAALCALLINGLIEFNFADGELVLVYSMLMGCAVAGVERLEFRPLGVRLQVH